MEKPRDQFDEFSGKAGRLVDFALDDLFEEDIALVRVDANERSICAALAAHLRQRFPDFDVDVEYNRLGPLDIKRLNLQVPAGLDTETSVIPDIIVHRRTTEENLLVIEVKKRKNPGLASYRRARDFDLHKLDCYKSQLGYRYAFFVELPIGESAERTGVDVVSR